MTQARIESVDLLKMLRATLAKFAEAANVALGDAEGEMQRILMWLEMEQTTFWQGQIRKRQEAVVRAQEAVREKTLYKDSTGSRPSAVEEIKALQIAKRRLEEAEEKLKNVRRAIPRLQKEIQQYKGSVQRFATTVQGQIPMAMAQLANMISALEQYLTTGIEAQEVQSQAASDQTQSVPSEAPKVNDESKPASQ
jgi:archaellum component FlaC